MFGLSIFNDDNQTLLQRRTKFIWHDRDNS